MTDQPPKPFPATALPAASFLLAGAAAFPLSTLASMIATGLAVPGIDNRYALMTYAAIVLSFMGAVHWGLQMALPEVADAGRLGAKRDWRIIMTSMVPGLVAWIGLLLPEKAGAVLMILGYAALPFYDVRATQWGEAPAYFLKLRLPVIVFAVGSLVVGILMRWN